MTGKSRTYRKISGNGLSLILKRSLWQGPDHLLWVEGSIIQEQYKRFYFKDIQALILHRTSRWIIWALVWSVCFLLFGLIALLSGGTPYVSGALAGLCMLLLAVHWLKGPSCEVFLQTAVQLQKMSNLVRVRKAMKVLNKIKAGAEAVQGRLSEGSIAYVRSANEFTLTGDGDIQTDAESLRLSGIADDVGPYNPKLHWILFGFLLLIGLLRCAQLWFRTMPLAVVDFFGLGATLVLGIVVMVRWHAHLKGSLLSFASWLTLGFALIHGLASYGVFIVASMRNPSMAYNHWAVVKMFFDIQMERQPIIEAICIGVALTSVALGLFGVVAVLKSKPDRLASSLRQQDRP